MFLMKQILKEDQDSISKNLFLNDGFIKPGKKAIQTILALFR